MAFLAGNVYPTPPGWWLRRRRERTIRFTEVEVRLSRGGPGLDGLTIAFLSDLHAGPFMRERELVWLFERVAEREPDLVCLGGDLVENEEEDIRLYDAALGRIAPPLGTFAVPGNHEFHSDPTLLLWIRFLESHGVRALVNRGARIERGDDTLWIAGTDDLTFGAPDLDAALVGREPNEPALLLAHEPDEFRRAIARDVDLTLSGHTHGGQITFFGKTPFQHSRHGYLRGRFEEDGSVLYVGRGIGTTGPPVRFCAPPELPILTLRTT
jgi:predicted MPP superfamily phosphohydrolase